MCATMLASRPLLHAVSTSLKQRFNLKLSLSLCKLREVGGDLLHSSSDASPEPPDAASTSLRLLLRRLMVRRAPLTTRGTLRGAVPRPRRPRPPRVGAGSS